MAKEATLATEAQEGLPAKSKDDVFSRLYSINVNNYVEKKEGLTYLTWSWAWAQVKANCPDAQYTVVKNPQGLPYFMDAQVGVMVYTTVTIQGITHEMWLPVLDGGNRTMKLEPYNVETKTGKIITVGTVSMFDINKAIMRCLTKNLAMFGLALYIYAGEDLPEDEVAAAKAKAAKAKLAELAEKEQAFVEVKDATTIDALLCVWGNHPTLQKTQEFRKCVGAKKGEINRRIQQEEAQQEEAERQDAVARQEAAAGRDDVTRQDDVAGQEEPSPTKASEKYTKK